MSVVINTNNSATVSAFNLARNTTELQKSLARLSSGQRIVSPADDAGGLAVSMKLTAQIHRLDAVRQNVANAMSFLQVQDGALTVTANLLDRISELKTMSMDVTKNAEDLANYNAEFREIQEQLINISEEKFNGINLFDVDGLTAFTTEDGVTGQVGITRSGVFSELAKAELQQRTISSSAYALDTAGGETTTLTISTPTFGLSATIILDDGSIGRNGSDISAAVKAINDELTLQGMDTIKASENSDGQLVITGSEHFTISETIGGGFAGLGLGADTAGTAKTYDGVEKSYQYNALADYEVGDVVAGVRADGSKESFVINTAVSGNGRTFDDFAALANTTRLDRNADPGTKVFVANTSTHAAGEVVYDDASGRYYLSRGDGTYANSSTAAADATDETEFLLLGNTLPALSQHDAYSSTRQYVKDDIVSYDGDLYVATTDLSRAAGSPLDNNTDTPPAWLKLSVAVSSNNDLLDSENGLQDFSIADITGFIQTLATARAKNGAEAKHLQYADEMLVQNRSNVEAANSRIMDVDVAMESTQFAKNNILVQSSASMLAQANTLSSIALTLLGQ
jgi:flagellin-like hook-associated protein FlgL